MPWRPSPRPLLDGRGVPARTSDPDGCLTELVRGRIVTFPFHGFRHGVICGRLCSLIGTLAEEGRRGHSFVGTGIITRRDPTTPGPGGSAKGSLLHPGRERYDKATAGDNYFSIPPDLIFEVLEHDERRSSMTHKGLRILGDGRVARQP